MNNELKNSHFFFLKKRTFMIFLTLEHILTHISFSVISVVITIHFFTLFAKEVIGQYDSSKKGVIVSFVCITGLLITRWVYSGHFPLSDLYESLIFLSWSFFLIHLVFFFKKDQNDLSAITVPSAIFTQGFTISGLLTKMDQSPILVPALQSQWLMMHVSMMVLGYAALLCGSLLSVALLVITFRKGIKIFPKTNNLLTGSFSFEKIQYMNQSSNVLLKTYSLSSEDYYRYKLTQQLDRWSFSIIRLGFVFLTIGILSGAVWANESWGSYWNWDPKETWAFITWTIFAIYLHIRTNPDFKIFNSAISSAILACTGFIIIWMCYFGVNLLGIGLHSYGSFNS